MAAITVRVFDADRKPIAGRMDVRVLDARDEVVLEKREVRAGVALTLQGLAAAQRHHVRVFPARHRPVGQLVVPGSGAASNVHLFCPVDPDRASPRFPAWTDLAEPLRQVLERSQLEDDTTTPVAGSGRTLSGQVLYESLLDQQRGGLLNLFCKLQATPLGLGSAWDFVQHIYRVRGDRLFADVTTGMRDHVKTALTTGRFREVSGSLHTPPPGFGHAGSFKTDDSFGNLQLTFFVSNDAPIRFRIDADIDDAAGLGHVFQVLRNSVKDRTTHPYDIHQVLTFHQLLRPAYDVLA